MKRSAPRIPAPRAPAPRTAPARAGNARPGAAADPTAQLRALMARVTALREQGRVAETIPLLVEARALAPAQYDLHVLLASSYQRTGQLERALGEFAAIAQAHPRRSDAYANLAAMLCLVGAPGDALAIARQAVALDPRSAAALTNLGETHKLLGDWPAARDAYARAVAIAPDDAKARMQLGMTQVTMGEWPAGWAALEWRDRVAANTMHVEALASPAWDGTAPLDGRTVLMAHEQGLGDAIMCVRFARDLAARGATVIVRAPAALAPLLASAPGITTASVLGTPLPAHDLHVRAMSLPALLALVPAALDGAPYLTPAGDCPPAIAAALPRDGVPTVAIAWAGNPQHVNDRRRSIDGRLLAPLLAMPGVRFAALQKHPALATVLPPALHDRVIDLAPLCDDFTASAHALARANLVLTVDSAVAHLAGAIGAPTLVAIPTVPDYRWLLERSDTPWYASMTLVRQSTLEDWTPVLDGWRDRVRALAAARGGAAA
ncbi:MAG: tetratricopeptide repeat-containing glycosyltransferase family protein [Gemmatimonadaceae bacterium]|nr:tetratricopeptide repeat-containing glycosyltransferase family protein [Gemmatimonadaceae bacterium]